MRRRWGARLALAAAIAVGLWALAPVTARGAVTPGAAAADVQVSESATAVIFTITLDRVASRAVRIDYTTADGTAQAGKDYRAKRGSVRVRAGASEARIDVPLLNDAVTERAETFELRLARASGATILDATATATIADDDPPCPAYKSIPNVLHCRVPVDGLGQVTNHVLVALPSSYDHVTPRPVVYLLHGVADSFTTWVDRTDIERVAASRNAIVVMPDGGHGQDAGWYSDWVDGSRKWETYHTRQLVSWIDSTFVTLGDGHRAVVGVSMGGLGALYYAAAHPSVFSAAGSISGIVDTQLYGPAEGYAFRVGNGQSDLTLGTPDERVWGDPVLDRQVWTAHNPAALAERGALAHLDGRLWLRTGNGVPVGTPDPFNADGSAVEHFVWQTNRSFLVHAELGDTRRRYHETLGTHDWTYHWHHLHSIYDEVVASIR